MKALTLIGFLLVLTGCTTNPVGDAQRPETVAFALHGGYVIAVESAADISEKPTTPDNIKVALKAAVVKASPVDAQLEPAAQAVEKVRADVEAGGGSKGLLQTSIDNLNNWITQFAPLMKNLTDAVKGAKP